MSIQQLTKESQASSAAVIRLCRSLGIAGFPTLKLRLSTEIYQGKQIGYLDINSNESINSIVDKALSNTLQTLYDTVNQLNTHDIEKAVLLIDQADTLYIYGIGASKLISEDISQKWRRLGKKTYVISDPHVLITTISIESKKALFFGFSYSGETKEVINLMKKAKEYGLKTIGLSCLGNNKLSQIADVSLSIARAPETKLLSAATSSRLAQLFIVDIVFLAYASPKYEFTIQQLEKTRQAIKNLSN